MSQEIKICSSNSGCFLGGLSAADTIYSGNIIHGTTIVKDGGTSSQFLKADGSVDTNTYTTCTGDVTGIDAGTAITVADGATATPTVGVTTACDSAWNAKTTCTGTVTSVTGGDGIDSSGGATPDITVDSTVVRTTGTQSVGGSKTFSSAACFSTGTAALPGITFSDDTATGLSRSTNTLCFIAEGASRAHITSAGIFSQANVYTAAGSEFRNFSGEWHGTTGTTGCGFKFENTVDGVVLDISSTGDTCAYGSISAQGGFLSGGVNIDQLFGAGGGVDAGTACKLTKYNAAGDNVEDSIVTEGSSLITIVGALDVDNICSNDASNNICYGLNVGGGGIANTSIGCCAANAMSTGFNNVAIGPASMKAANGVCCNVAIGVNAAEDLTTGGDDNVAIGTFAMLNGTTTTDSVAIGKCSMGVGVTTGACNVAIGFETMKNTTSGCNNTAVGGFSMAANATGEFNTSLGFKSLCSIVGGDRNVAVGNTAGKSITSGCDNVAIGHNALCSSANGCFNVAIGIKAAAATTSGTNNVVLGDCASSGNTTGSHNVTIGSQAGFYALSGDHNLGIGQFALYDNWGGDYNTALGSAAMQCNTTGSNNAALGYRAMMNNTTGNDNFAVGECALQSNVNGIGNTALGHNAFGSSVTGNYTVAIGDNAGAYQADGCSTLSAAGDSIYIGRNTRGKKDDTNSITIGYNACSCGQNTIRLGNNSITAACIHVAWTVTSDERDKTDIADLNYGLNFIGELAPKAFKYRNNRTTTATDNVCRYGFLAQDIQEVEDGDHVIVDERNQEQFGINSDYLIPILVNAVKELKTRVEALEAP